MKTAPINEIGRVLAGMFYRLVSLSLITVVLNGCGSGNDATNALAPDNTSKPDIASQSVENALGSIDGVPISTDVFATRARERRPNLPSALGGENDENTVCFKRELVWELIDETLLEKEAAKRNVTVTEGEVNEAVRLFAERFGTPQAFQQYLSSHPGGEDALKREQRLALIRSRLAGKAPQATEEEIRQFYQQHENRYQHAAYLLADEIVLLDREGRDEQAELSALRQRILDNDLSFSHQARKLSESDTAKQGGDMGRVTNSSVPPAVWNAIKALAVGKISAPVSAGDKTRIVQVRDRVAAASITMADATNSIRQELEQRRQLSREKELIRQLRAQAKVHNSFMKPNQESGTSGTLTAGGGVSPNELLDQDLKQGGKASLHGKTGS